MNSTPTTSKVYDILPAPFEWIEIPSGRVTVENKTETLSNFQIAKYSTTNAQFAKLIEAGGYKDQKWWTKEGWQIKEEGNWTTPRYWQNDKSNDGNHPVVRVSWYEVAAFCRWLSDASGEIIRLPTEQQWQRAAQDDDGRAYPWGNDWDDSRCNNSVSPMSSNSTSSVTQYEGHDKGDSPFGVVDLAGNVWEWCTVDYPVDDNPSYVRTEDLVLCGGSWWNNFKRDFSVVYGRDEYDPYEYSGNCGFRITRT